MRKICVPAETIAPGIAFACVMVPLNGAVSVVASRLDSRVVWVRADWSRVARTSPDFTWSPIWAITWSTCPLDCQDRLADWVDATVPEPSTVEVSVPSWTVVV